MEEKSKGFSLRQKKSSRRPPISAPQQIQSSPAQSPALVGNGNGNKHNGNRPGGSSGSSESTSQPRRPSGNTVDLVKRRYSTRFTTLADFRNADVPPIPALPTGNVDHPTQQKTQLGSAVVHDVDIDLDALKDPGLQADQCECSDVLL